MIINFNEKKRKMNLTYISSGQTPFWSRCDTCGELNIVSETNFTCTNCKSEVKSLLRELSESEIKDRVFFIN